jgi:hypothetical protein
MPDKSIPPTDDALALAVTLFLTAKEGQRCSVHTLDAYRLALAKFTTWLRGQNVTRPDSITPHVVRSYFAELGKSDLTAWSVHDYARVVRTRSQPMSCKVCGNRIWQAQCGRMRCYCSDACRQFAYRGRRKLSAKSGAVSRSLPTGALRNSQPGPSTCVLGAL